MAARSTPHVLSLLEKNARHRPQHLLGLACAASTEARKLATSINRPDTYRQTDEPHPQKKKPLANTGRAMHFSPDLLHNIDLEIALSEQLLEFRVLRLQLAPSLHVRRLELPEALAPQTYGLITGQISTTLFAVA